MNDKNLKVLEQYDMEVKNIRRGRGCYVLETDRGIVLLKEYKASVQRAAWVEKVCRALQEAGMQVDVPIACREGDFVSCDREGNRYMVKQWNTAREIDVNNIFEIYEAVANLARLHRILIGFGEQEMELDSGILWSEEKTSQERLFEKRIRELRKIWRYVKEKKRKNPFELSFMKEYKSFMEMCEEALHLSGQEHIQQIRHAAWERGCVCHGDYNQHNILREAGNIITVNFENAMIGVQTDDLYCFMRKMLEKHNWRLELAKGMLDTYTKECPLSKEDFEELYIKFLFPEKFWKISNHYYNSKKTWIPDRSLQKLDKLILQSRFREAFIDSFKHQYLH